MNWSIFTEEKPFLLSHQGLLLPEVLLEELAQGPHNVVGIHHGPPGQVVGVDQHLHIKEGSSHQLRASGMNLGLNRTCQSLIKPLF